MIITSISLPSWTINLAKTLWQSFNWVVKCFPFPHDFYVHFFYFVVSSKVHQIWTSQFPTQIRRWQSKSAIFLMWFATRAYFLWNFIYKSIDWRNKHVARKMFYLHFAIEISGIILYHIITSTIDHSYYRKILFQEWRCCLVSQ